VIASASINASLTGSRSTLFSCLVERWLKRIERPDALQRVPEQVEPHRLVSPRRNASMTPPRIAYSPRSDTVDARA
jgi:hypothetical protein